MSKKKIELPDSLKFRSVQLTRVDAKHIVSKEKNVKTDMIKDWEYEFFIAKEKKLLLFQVVSHVYFQPARYMDLKLEYDIIYQFDDDLTEEQVNENAETLAEPCTDINSLMIGNLTDKMVGTVLIIPPFPDFKKKSAE